MDLLNNYKIMKTFYHVSQELDTFNSSYIYGEARPLDIVNILKSHNYDELDSFIDIGSGCGKIVLSVAFMLNINATGVEIDKNRYKQSLKLLENTQLHNLVYFENCNFQNIYFGNYTILYCCNLVFCETTNKLLYNKIINEFTGVFILCNYDYSLKKYLKSTHVVKTSWNVKQNLYVFYK